MNQKTDVLQGTLALMEQRTAIIGRFFAAKAEDLS